MAGHQRYRPAKGKRRAFTKDEVLEVMAAQREAEERWRYDTGEFEADPDEDTTLVWNREYPRNWPEIRSRISKRAKGRCECRGECGMRSQHGGRRWGYGLRRRCSNVKNLGTAHLCRKKPCRKESHLKAMCLSCHWGYDRTSLPSFLRMGQPTDRCLLDSK